MAGKLPALPRTQVGKSVQNKCYTRLSQSDILPVSSTLQRTPYSSLSGRNDLGRGVHSCIRGLKDEYGCRKSS